MFRLIRDRFRPTLAVRLGFLVLTSTGLIFLVTFGYFHQVVRGLMLNAAQENTRNLAGGTVHQIEAVLKAVEPLTQLVARQVEDMPFSEVEVIRLLRNQLLSSPHVFGGAVALAPEHPAAAPGRAAPYVCRHADRLEVLDLSRDGDDYLWQDWYLIPRETGRAAWTDPYFDEGGGEAMMCTYAVPIYREEQGERVFAGVVTADLLLEHLVDIVSGIRLAESGHAFLLSQNGQFISHPNPAYVFCESPFSLADETGDPQWRVIGRMMLRGGQGFVRAHAPGAGTPVWLHYAPISSGWSVGVQFAEEEVLAGLNALHRVVLWIGIIGFGVLLAVITALSLRVTRPIQLLAQQTHAIAHGNLDLPVPPATSHDEVGQLSQSFEDMRLALKDYIANLAATTAAKERIESELKIAQAIQRSFLPRRFPPFPDHLEFDIHAELEAARNVGGDLYDYFLVDNRHLFFSVGDVSGKGVPAALFMAVTKTLMKGVAQQRLPPHEILIRVNRELCQDNEQMMFVTICCGWLDLHTGRIEYSNAGHLPPLRTRPGPYPRWVDLPRGTLLGIAPEATYETRTLQLDPMETLLLYTDGVTEAMNARRDLFGDDRLQTLVGERLTASPKDLVEAVIDAVHRFADGEEPSDDITVLALRHRGRAPASRASRLTP